MNKTLLSTALVAAFAAAAFAPSAQAAGGTITISGKVVADTCVVDVNGGATVVLPTVTTADLSSVGAVAGATNFNLGLTGCDTHMTSATMGFSGTNIATNGNLNNTTPVVGPQGAPTVQVQLLEGANVIDMNTQANAPAIAVASGSGSTTLTARYYANGGAVPASLVTSTVNFTLTYL